MSRKTIAMFTLTAVGGIGWMLRFLPQSGLPGDWTDFAGGLAIGALIGALVSWAGERTPGG